MIVLTWFSYGKTRDGKPSVLRIDVETHTTALMQIPVYRVYWSIDGDTRIQHCVVRDAKMTLIKVADLSEKFKHRGRL